MKRIIHVDQARIRHNIRAEPGDELAPIIVRTYKGSTRSFEAVTTGPVTFFYRPKKPLSCGARLWAETTSPVQLDDGRVI